MKLYKLSDKAKFSFQLKPNSKNIDWKETRFVNSGSLVPMYARTFTDGTITDFSIFQVNKDILILTDYYSDVIDLAIIDTIVVSSPENWFTFNQLGYFVYAGGNLLDTALIAGMYFATITVDGIVYYSDLFCADPDSDNITVLSYDGISPIVYDDLNNEILAN